ncbi:biotin transporter BioY [Sporolactobacillus shoreicorticis]|uniref:Biotin transporter n=1 Tax=Sporolactobacillus shoreicorticis TaxID=1923877 RepID=A0ABW5S1U9_9BACL|nr:biotin transporter BioY [Sporolactobacillus shoreicorticis]MCO7128286.1 biotin transporter BioY [Sporolactobacillus shoreicorticis]
MNHTRLKNLILCALFAAITAILAQITIPLPIIPISGQTLAVGLTATILGSRYGTASMIVYAGLGAIGLPVFAGMSGGFGVILGPSGGYIIGFILSAFVTGLILEHTKFSTTMAIVANIIGMFVTLAIGTLQLKFILDLSWTKAWAAGVYPFLIVGVVKAVIASVVGIQVRQRLTKFGFLKSGKQQTAA